MASNIEKTYTLNTAPSLTWNWLKSNCDTISLDKEILNSFENKDLSFSKLPEGITVEKQGPVTNLNPTGSGVFNIPDQKYGDEVKTAQNARITTAAKETKEDFSNLFDSVIKNPQHFQISGKVSEPLVLFFDNSAENLKSGNQINAHTIHALPNSQATVIILYKDSNAVKSQLVQTKIFAEEYSKINLIKAQLLSKETVQLDDTQIICGDNSEVSFVQLELGGKHVDSGLHTTLQGYQSKFKSNVAYLCQESQYLDMNHIVYHFGKKSECNMQVNGTLKDNAVKTYRGTIDFKNGCSGSKGNEMEETLLLSPAAVNKSLPVILCDEDDVEGEHGATIGRLSSDILFYMESRGIDEKAAEEIMSRAKIQACADLIPDEAIKEQITNWLENNQ